MSPSSDCSLSPRACDSCGTTQGSLLRCSACQVLYYCGASHQAADRKRHKKGCDTLKKARKDYANEEKALQEYRPPSWNNQNLFEVGVGCFWGILDTRDYMRARHRLVDTMLESFGGPGGRADAVQEASDHFMDMLRLCRSDNMGVRDKVPWLYIRLNKDQAAYDFMKWHATTGSEPRRDWDNMELPYLDVKNADILETPLDGWANNRFLELSHVAAVLLIKVRIDVVALN